MTGPVFKQDIPNDFTSQISERLKLARPCASGSFGDVYRFTIETGKSPMEVAVKVFKIDAGRAMEKTEKAMHRELMVWLKLKHSTIVPLLGTANVDSPFPALVSQWMCSGTLYMYLKQANMIVSAKDELISGVADGLKYLHSKNVIHGDLHPANVLVDDSGHPRLTDFGLATVAGDAELQLSVTTATRSLDPRWRAPEVIGIERDPERPTFESDIYSFGGIIFFVISGDIPWNEKNPVQICIEMSKRANPVRPDNIPDNHWNVIHRCWSWDPVSRPKATEVIIFFASEGATSGNSDESKAIPDPTKSSTDSESLCIVSLSGSLSSFEVVTPLVAGEDLYCESDLPSSLTQPCLKIDVDPKKYCDQPRDLTRYIIRTRVFPHSYDEFSDVWRCKLDSFPRNGIKMPPRDVAVKTFRVLLRNSKDMKTLIKKLRQEVFVWQELEHSHILPLYGTTDGFDIIPALVYPWMEDVSLRQYLDTKWQEQLPPKIHRLFPLLVQIVLGLQYLHYRNIIHGDLMPPNVLIDHNGNALLAGFGLSRLLADHKISFFKSHGPGAIRWAAPEIIPLNPEKPDDEVSKPNKASDIYSFGCIMMQVLSGQSPYFDMSETAVTVAKFKGILPTRPPAIADVYWCYLERCLSECVAARPLVDEVLEYIKAECDRQNFDFSS